MHAAKIMLLSFIASFQADVQACTRTVQALLEDRRSSSAFASTSATCSEQQTSHPAHVRRKSPPKNIEPLTPVEHVETFTLAAQVQFSLYNRALSPAPMTKRLSIIVLKSHSGWFARIAVDPLVDPLIGYKHKCQVVLL